MPGTSEAFTQGANTVSVSASVASASSAISAGYPQLLVTNDTNSLAFVTTGIGSATAAATSLPVGAKSQAVISVPVSHDFAAAILVSGTGTVYFTPGYGS